MDALTPEARSRNMSRIRSTGTKPEERLYELAVAVMGRRRKIIRNDKSLPGTPDLYVPSLKLAIFLDGCFFHSCPKHGRVPKSNLDYWLPKLARNGRRDRRNRRLLREQGISVWRFWEHELKGRIVPKGAALRMSSIFCRRLQQKL